VNESLPNLYRKTSINKSQNTLLERYGSIYEDLENDEDTLLIKGTHSPRNSPIMRNTPVPRGPTPHVTITLADDEISSDNISIPTSKNSLGIVVPETFRRPSITFCETVTVVTMGRRGSNSETSSVSSHGSQSILTHSLSKDCICSSSEIRSQMESLTRRCSLPSNLPCRDANYCGPLINFGLDEIEDPLIKKIIRQNPNVLGVTSPTLSKSLSFINISDGIINNSNQYVTQAENPFYTKHGSMDQTTLDFVSTSPYSERSQSRKQKIWKNQSPSASILEPIHGEIQPKGF